jgi:hypothetical protein
MREEGPQSASRCDWSFPASLSSTMLPERDASEGIPGFIPWPYIQVRPSTDGIEEFCWTYGDCCASFPMQAQYGVDDALEIAFGQSWKMCDTDFKQTG